MITPIYPPTYPPNHTPSHRWRILHRLQIFKQNQSILISSRLFFNWLGGFPQDWVKWVGMVCGDVNTCLCACPCTHAWTHIHACGTCVSNDVIMGVPLGELFLWGYSHLQLKLSCLYMYAHICAHAWGTPPPEVLN